MKPSKESLDWNPQGKRRRGRPKQTWRRSVHSEALEKGLSWGEVKRMAKNRIRWQCFVDALCPLRDNRKWWCLDMSESSSSCSSSAIHCSRSSSSVNSAARELRMSQVSASYKYGNHSGTSCASMRVPYFILPVGKSLEVINCFRLKLLPTAIQIY